MGHEDYKQVEDFLIDDTFQQYCSEENEQCIQYWENYIVQHPEQKDTINRARRLFKILTGNKNTVKQQQNNLQDILYHNQRKKRGVRYLIFLKIAAGFALFGFVYLWYLRSYDSSGDSAEIGVVKEVYQTIKGEKKTFTLTDGTSVTLNSDSRLQIDAEFGKSNRQVFLEGEAYLEVKKDTDKPFLLHTNEFDIRVLGTSFNVKSYPDELASEALLIEGIIELKSKGKNENSIIIKPNQKITIYKNGLAAAPKLTINKIQKSKADVKEIAIQDIRHNANNEILDILWKENKLAIVDQDFNEVKNVLERWYDVNITLEGEVIRNYRFTATFREESIDQVLNALKEVKPFKYKTDGKNITIYEK